MTSRVLAGGHGAAGVVTYCLHDENHGRSRTRVYGLSNRGYPLLDVDLSHEPDVAKVERLHARILQSTAADGPALKRAAAGSAAGRKCSQPIRHVALGWPADERPSWDDMESAADSWLEATGLTEHRVVLVGHREPGKADHLHLVICMVHPETGKVPKVNLARVGSRWAEAWERAHDRIVIPTRVARNAARRAAAEAHARGDSAGARAAFAQFPATEATRSNGRGKLPPAGRAAYAALRQEQEVEVAALPSLLLAEDASRREESRRIAALKKQHRRAADDLARAYRNGAVAVDEVAPAPQPERATTTTTPVAAAVDEPAPPPRELETEPEAKPTLTADQRRAAMEARSRLHNRWPEPEGIPLSTESLQRAAELLHNGDEVDLVGAHVLERTAVLRDRAAREKAELAESSRTAAAVAALIDALIETVRTLCRAALGWSGPASPPVRPTAATTPTKTPGSIDVAHDDQAPGGGQAR